MLLPLWFALRKFAHTQQRRRAEAMLLTAGVMLLAALVLGHIPAVASWTPLRAEHLLAGNGLFLLIGKVARETFNFDVWHGDSPFVVEQLFYCFTRGSGKGRAKERPVFTGL